ncbi:hypothetical protein GCM10027184_26770 [Saccharothrix stipae]
MSIVTTGAAVAGAAARPARPVTAVMSKAMRAVVRKVGALRSCGWARSREDASGASHMKIVTDSGRMVY